MVVERSEHARWIGLIPNRNWCGLGLIVRRILFFWPDLDLAHQLDWIQSELFVAPVEQPVLYFSMWARPTPPTSTLEWVDGGLASLIQRFVASTVMVCADHGDCWGEDDLWGHSISYPAWLVVPLLLRF